MRKTLIAALIVGGSLMGAARAEAVVGYELRQTLGEGDSLRLVVAKDGALAVETRGEDESGGIANYRSGRLYGLTFADHTYRVDSLARRVAALRRERREIAKLQIEVALEDGSHVPKLELPSFTPLELTATIAGQPAHAYAYHVQGGQPEIRVWLADRLPAAPPALRKRLVRALPTASLSTRGVILRDETLIDGKWVTGLDTLRIRKTKLTPRAFAPPKGWRLAKRLAASAGASSTPARVLRLVGPVSTFPDVFALYWGSFGAGAIGATNGLLASMISGTSNPYWSAMSQYGVGPGRFIGFDPARYPLYPSIGSWNFIAIGAMVVNSYFTTKAPKIWWYFGGHDPIIAIMVPRSAVDVGGWDGYHLDDVSLQPLLPWPVNMLAHPEMPWLIVKADSTTAAPDPTTAGSISHELVEAASDPLPLWANVDLTKSPPWEGAEIADICKVGSPLPPVITVNRFGFELSRYWSNGSRSCVG